ncbi:hypothetical protein AB3R30_08780 [Leptolyngbyaceae cyanobacterium UHCC 1019]
MPTLTEMKGNHKGLPLRISYLDSATPKLKKPYQTLLRCWAIAAQLMQ